MDKSVEMSFVLCLLHKEAPGRSMGVMERWSNRMKLNEGF